MKKLFFLALVLVVSLASFSSWPNSRTTRVAYFSIAVKDLEQVAEKLSKAGFTLKKSHLYKEGFQRGLRVQSIKLKNGQYLQLVSLNSKDSSTYGELAKWYEKRMNDRPIGLTITLEGMPYSLDQIQKSLKKESISSQYQKYPRYEWLSFPSESPYAHLTFIDNAYQPQDSDEVLTHDNGAYALAEVGLRPFGETSKWVKILTLSGARESQLSFDTPLFSGKGFIDFVEVKTKKTPLPEPLSLGHIRLKFIN
ncbi:MAG: hypothetical protein CME63_08500 [Halobacteriovoraceae bacterium]|nr:hypothetical protein [Halobacteriovoraceae bacterium]